MRGWLIPLIRNKVIHTLSRAYSYPARKRSLNSPHPIPTQYNPRLRTELLPQSLLSPLPSSQKIFRCPRLRWYDNEGVFIVPKEEVKSAVNAASEGDALEGAAKRKATPMKSWVELITTPTADTPGTALLVHFEDKRYIVGNLSEGTQRACLQRGTGLSKVENMFITGKVSWATAGGMLGMVLTLADVFSNRIMALKSAGTSRSNKEVENCEGRSLNIHGGRNLTHLMATARRFIFRKGTPLRLHEIKGDDRAQQMDWSPTWSDSNIKVWAMAVSPAGSSQKSPRKRTSDEISQDFEHPVNLDGVTIEETPEEAEERYDQLRKLVVDEMFGSDWTLDTLHKTPLSEVQMPATIFVRNEEGKLEKYEGPMPGGSEPLPDIEVLVRKPWPAALITSLPPTQPSTAAISYIIKNYSQRGKFDPKKAVELGVKPGREFGKLTKGIEVPGKDGKMVRPEMVMGPDQPGKGFGVFEIPSSEYIEPLLNRQEWHVEEVIGHVEIIFWLLGPGVRVEGRLHEFMLAHPEFEHVVSSPDYCSNYLAFESPAASAIRLHQIDSDHFPIPVHDNNSKVEWNEEVTKSPRPFHVARIGHRSTIYPKMKLQTEEVTQYLDTAAVIQEASPELLELAEIAQREVSDPKFLAKLEEQQKDIPSKDAEITTLGTGSALPSKYRNVSATLVRVPGYGNYLLDCGESTLGQLKRVFGKELPSLLQNLKMIWISHLHADHHLGTTSVVRAWHEATRDSEDHKNHRLIVASDRAMLDWLSEYSAMEDFGYDRLHLMSLSPNHNQRSKKIYGFHLQNAGLSTIEACRVQHCKGALAVSLTFPNSFKVSYSGDCRPSDDFVEIGKNSTVLIHEATFDDELVGEAVAKKHSTTGEALDVGKRMGARRILLTHFSQRYHKIPVMSEEGGSDDVKAGVGFDYMRVTVGDIAKLEAFRPALLKLLAEKDADEEVEEVLDEAEIDVEATSKKGASEKKNKQKKA